MSFKKFIPLDIQPVHPPFPEIIIIDDDGEEDKPEEISDDEIESENQEKDSSLEEAKKEFETNMQDPDFRKAFLQPSEEKTSKKITIINKPQIVVVRNTAQSLPQPPIAESISSDLLPVHPPIMIEPLIRDIIEFHQIEKLEQRRKERQRIKRKKANRRKFKKHFWMSRKNKHHSFPFHF